MKFSKESIALCKKIAEKHRKELEYGDWYYDEGFKESENPFSLHLKELISIQGDKPIFPLWQISDCLEFLEKKGLDHIFNFMQFKNGGWRFTAEDRKYKKVLKEGESRLVACLKAVLAIVEES